MHALWVPIHDSHRGTAPGTCSDDAAMLASHCDLVPAASLKSSKKEYTR
jgi:hypothetical protein